jgi:hypothetical protein
MTADAEGMFKVWRVAWPEGSTYIGVRRAETVESFRSRLGAAARNFGTPYYTNRLAKACRDLGELNAQIGIIASYPSEAEAVFFANGLIDELATDKRLNVGHLATNAGRRPAAER